MSTKTGAATPKAVSDADRSAIVESVELARAAWKTPALVRVEAALAELGGSGAPDEASQS